MRTSLFRVQSMLPRLAAADFAALLLWCRLGRRPRRLPQEAPLSIVAAGDAVFVGHDAAQVAALRVIEAFLFGIRRVRAGPAQIAARGVIEAVSVAGLGQGGEKRREEQRQPNRAQPSERGAVVCLGGDGADQNAAHLVFRASDRHVSHTAFPSHWATRLTIPFICPRPGQSQARGPRPSIKPSLATLRAGCEKGYLTGKLGLVHLERVTGRGWTSAFFISDGWIRYPCARSQPARASCVTSPLPRRSKSMTRSGPGA